MTDDHKYVGRIAPTPSGHLHVGHAQTFLIAQHRALMEGGVLILRIEDLDTQRCKEHYVSDMIEDLEWFGIDLTTNNTLRNPAILNRSAIETEEYLVSSDEPVLPETGCLKKTKLGECPNTTSTLSLHRQSGRKEKYLSAWLLLLQRGYIYPSPHSRKDVESAISAPHEGDEEQIFPISLHPAYLSSIEYGIGINTSFPPELQTLMEPSKVNWRFRVPDDRAVEFVDLRRGLHSFVAGKDFGDFLVWRGSDNIPSYELAVVVDDSDMGVTEVVRGEDLILSTARQLLLYEALGISNPPKFYHCPLLRDDAGRRLAKRAKSKTLRSLREEGYSPQRIRDEFFDSETREMLARGAPPPHPAAAADSL